MANILLGVTGSVAAIKTPALCDELRRAEHKVKVVATRSALYFFDPHEVDPSLPSRNPSVVIIDEDEWPGLDVGQKYQRADDVLHIELRRWADLFLIAPLNANTLAKLAAGLADNCLTCVWRAWEPARPVVLAPAMNTLMWQHPLTARHLRQLAADAGAPASEQSTLSEIVEGINRRSATLRIAPPQIKTLACGDLGIGALAELADIVTVVRDLLAASAPHGIH